MVSRWTEHSTKTKLESATTKYVSQLQRLKSLRTEQAVQQQTIISVEEFQEFVKRNSVDDPAVRAKLVIKGRVVWSSFCVVKTGDLARIHFVDLQAEELLNAM
ncbi:hypothetical protein PHMEG_0005302 [Phytophthora megakarya]|uniref:Uncharacterized protein n=1 Tax=Phytophthora megakarya TaxID=4795 RepID=A0A225WRM0_9STRA|nr:hypothetical protein PHMEG_0005302 [Phytophthora megakarya]